MYEFRIVQQIKNGKKFSLHSFYDFVHCYAKLHFLVNNCNFPYVHHNFWHNVFTENEAINHFWIETREVTNFIPLENSNYNIDYLFK